MAAAAGEPAKVKEKPNQNVKDETRVGGTLQHRAENKNDNNTVQKHPNKAYIDSLVFPGTGKVLLYKSKAINAFETWYDPHTRRCFEPR